MKRLFAIITVVMMCVSLMVPAMAAQDFTPSVTNKPAPGVISARIIGKDGEVIKEITDCLIITPVSEVDTSTEIPEASRTVLKDVYSKLQNGSMTIPYEKHNDNLDSSKMVIRDLFDATFVCTECPELLEPEGVVLEIVFDLNIDAGVTVYAMTYKDNEWNPIVSTSNNADGTVTAVFEKLCPVEFSINTDPEDNGGTGDTDMSMWGILAIASLAAIVVLTVVYRSGSKKQA